LSATVEANFISGYCTVVSDQGSAVYCAGCYFFSKFTRAMAPFPMIRPKYDSVSISSVADQLNESEFQ